METQPVKLWVEIGNEDDPYLLVGVAGSLGPLARLGVTTDEEIEKLQADGLTLLWRHGDWAFMAVTPEATVVQDSTLLATNMAALEGLKKALRKELK